MEIRTAIFLDENELQAIIATHLAAMAYRVDGVDGNASRKARIMKTILLAATLTLAAAGTAEAQCPQCTPSQQPAPQQLYVPAQQLVPGVMMIRQRRGLFGWRRTWTAVPALVRPAPPVYWLR